MKDFTKIYLDLSKLSREELMTLPQILKKAGETLLYPIDFNDVKYWSTFHKPNYANYWTLGTPRSTPEKNELTYPEFIQLFEGGETSAENSEVERIRRSAIENLVLMEIDKKMEHLKEIEVARIEGVLTGLKICKEMWAQGTISHENIQEEIYHYQEELKNLKSNNQ